MDIWLAMAKWPQLGKLLCQLDRSDWHCARSEPILTANQNALIETTTNNPLRSVIIFIMAYIL